MSITAKSSKAYSIKIENVSVELLAKSRHLKATPRLSAKYVNLQTFTGSQRSSQPPASKPSSESKKPDVDSDNGYNSSEFEEEKGSKSAEQSERLLSAISRFQKSTSRKSPTELEAGTMVPGFRAPNPQDVAVSSTTAFTRPSKPQNQFAKRMAYYEKVRDLSLSAKGPESRVHYSSKEKSESIRAKQLLYDEKVRKMNWQPLPPVPAPADTPHANVEDTYNKLSADTMNDVYFAKSFGIPDESELERKQSEFDYEEPATLHLPAKRLLESKSSPQRYFMRTSDEYEEEEPSSSPPRQQQQRLSPPPTYEDTIQQKRQTEEESEVRVFFPAARKAVPSPSPAASLAAPTATHRKKHKSDRSNKSKTNKVVTRSLSSSRSRKQQQGEILPMNESTQTSLSFPKQQTQQQTMQYEDEAIQGDQPAIEAEEPDEDINTLIELPEIRLSLSERLGHYFESKASSRDVSFTSASIAPHSSSGGYRIANAAARRALQQAGTFGTRISRDANANDAASEPLMVFPDITKYIPNLPSEAIHTGKSLSDIIYRGQIHAPYPRYDSSDDEQADDDYQFQDDDDRGPEYGVVNTIMKKMAVEKQKTKDAKWRLEQQQLALRQQQKAKEESFTLQTSSSYSPERKSSSVDIEAIKQQIKHELEEESREIFAAQDAWIKAIEHSSRLPAAQPTQPQAQSRNESTALKLRMQMMAELEKQDRLFQYTLELQDLTTHQQPPIIISNTPHNNASNANKQLEETTRELLRTADRNMPSTEATIEESERLLTLYHKLQESQVAMATQQAYQRNMELYQNLAMLPLLDQQQAQLQQQQQQRHPPVQQAQQQQVQAPTSPAYSNRSVHRTPYVIQEVMNMQTQTSPERRSISASIMAFGSPLSTRSSPQRRQPPMQAIQQVQAASAPHATEAIGKLRLQELETRHTERMAWLDHVMRLHLTTTTEAADERVRMEELHRAELERLYDSLSHPVATQPKSALAANLVGNSRLSKAQSFGVDELLQSPSPAALSVSLQQRPLPALPSAHRREKVALSAEKAQLQQLQQLVAARHSPARDRYTPRQEEEEEEEEEEINILPRHSKLTVADDVISPLNSVSYSTSIDREREKEKYSPAAAISRSWLHPTSTMTAATSIQEDEEENEERLELQALAQKIMTEQPTADTFSSDEAEEKQEEQSAAFEIEESDHSQEQEEDEYLDDTFVKSTANQSQSIIAPATRKQQQIAEDSSYGGYSQDDFHHQSQQQQQEPSYSYSFTAPSTSVLNEVEEEEFLPSHHDTNKQQQQQFVTLDEEEVPEEEVHESSLAMSIPDETGLDLSQQSSSNKQQHSLTLSIADDTESKSQSKGQGLMAISSTVEEDDEYEEDAAFEEDKGGLVEEDTYGTASFEVSTIAVAAAPQLAKQEEEEEVGDEYEEDFDQSKPNIPQALSLPAAAEKQQQEQSHEEESVPEEDIPEEVEEEEESSDDYLNYSNAQLAPAPTATIVPTLPVQKEQEEEEYEEEGFETAEGSSQSRQSTPRSLAMPPAAMVTVVAVPSEAVEEAEDNDGNDDDYDETFEGEQQSFIAVDTAKKEQKAVKPIPEEEEEEIEEEVAEEIIDTEGDEDEDSLSPSKQPAANENNPPFSPHADKTDLLTSSSQHSSPAVRRLSLDDRDRSDSLELGLNDLPTDPSHMLYERLQKVSTVSTNESNMIFDYDQQRWIGGDDVSLGGFEESGSESSSPNTKPKLSVEDGLIIEEEGVTMTVKTIDGHHAKELADYYPIRSFAALAPSTATAVADKQQQVVVRDIDELLDDLSVPSDDDYDNDDDYDKKEDLKTHHEDDDHSLSEFKDSFSGPPDLPDDHHTTAIEQQQAEHQEQVITEAEQIGDLIMARLVAEAVEVVTRSLSSSTLSSDHDHDYHQSKEDEYAEEPVTVLEDEGEIDLTLQSATMTYDHIAKIEAVLQQLDVFAASSLLQSRQQGAISKADIGLDISSSVNKDDQVDWGYEVYSDRVLEFIISLQQSSASKDGHHEPRQRISDRLDIASSLLLLSSSSNDHAHGEMIRAYLRHKLLTEASNNSNVDSHDIWSNLDHDTLALVIDQADQTLNLQIDLMTDQFLAQARDEANSNQR